jgi:serine beta-lactamase-like protein LACTB, mitochondrial
MADLLHLTLQEQGRQPGYERSTKMTPSLAISMKAKTRAPVTAEHSFTIPQSQRFPVRLAVRLAPLLLTIILAGQPRAQTQEGLSEQQIEAINGLVTSAMSKDVVGGVSVAVAKAGKLVWSDGYGLADVENNVPATAQTMYRTASISKWLTASAALRLVEDGKLDLDAPVQRYCPQYPEKQWPLTSRHLLSHIGGVRHYHGANRENPSTDAERRKLEEARRREGAGQVIRYTDVIKPLDAFKDDPLLFQPGTRFNYTSHGYRLLGCVVEGAAGVPYRDLMRNLVFRPGHMQSITEDDAFAIVPHRTAGYSKDADGKLMRTPFRDVSENLPAGGHLTTAADLVRFVLAFNDGKIVRAETRNQMIARPTLLGSPGPDTGGNYYGMGISVGTLNGKQMLSHGGGQNGTSTLLMSLPQSGVAVAVMANRDAWSQLTELTNKIAELLSR